MSKPPLKDEGGRLTTYGLSCGYVEMHVKDEESGVTLSYRHGVYVINGFLADVPFSETARTLATARKKFDDKKRQMRGS